MKKTPCEPQIGADIEVFLYDNVRDTIVPCVGVINGTKDKPFIPKDYVQGFALQEDNVMLEYNIPPAKTSATWAGRFPVAHTMIMEHIPKHHGWRVLPEHQFMPNDLRSNQAKAIGCEPDHSAYDGGEERVIQVELTNWRSCGGHIHLGGNFNCPDFVAALFAELCLGIGAGLRTTEPNTRTTWYGQPGIFRPKEYGIEYRTPDNMWTNNADTIHRVGTVALALCRYLTTNEAAVLRKAFRAITWPRLRDYMTPDTKRDQNTQRAMADAIVQEALTAGVPI